MKPFFSKRQSFAIQAITGLFVLSACIWTQSVPQTAGVPATAGAPDGPTTVATAGEIHVNVEFGPGSFTLEDPTVGLADLSSYKTTLKLSFDGTQDGQPKQWSRMYTMLASLDPVARRITVDATGSGSDKSPVFIAEMNGVSYGLDGENKCTASIPEAGTSLADTWEPAGFLSPIIGAEAAGSETINGLATDQYTFDERALGEAGFTQSTGQVWVTSENRVVVRYLLTTTAGANYFGDGIDGTLTWDYNLTDINQPVTIDLSRTGIGDGLPAVCPGGLVDLLLMADAQDINQLPDMTSYSTAGSIADVLAFYKAQLPPLGWAASGEPSVAETVGLADFVKGDQQLSVIVTSSDAMSQVRLVVGVASATGVTP